MGHGIAHVAALAGYDVTLVDASLELAMRGVDRVRHNLDEGVMRGKVQRQDRDDTLARLHARDDVIAAAADADIVIEAVPEKMALKVDVFSAVENAAPASAILASNTSSLSITELQSKLRRPERVVGLHFFNPVHILKLVEVVRGEVTSDDVVELAASFARRLGKDPIVVKDSPGFASSRLGIALGLEAMRMVEEGVASAEDIDKAMELGYRHPMGPLRLTDLVGLDVRLDIAEHLHKTLGQEHFAPPKILRDMVEDGKLGKKSGEGFYKWEDA